MAGTGTRPDLRLVQPAASEATLKAVLQSRTFARAEKLQRFLKFVCEMTFRGDSALVHEHRIAVDVFGRGEDYSPGEDSVVRRQAHALRRKLKEYYESEGLDDPIQIELPVGTYVPVFRERREPELPARLAEPLPVPRMRWFPNAAGLVLGAVAVLAAAAWGGWALRSRAPVSQAAQFPAQAALREIWGSWLAPGSSAVLCFSNPPATSVRQFAGPIQPNPEHQGVAVTPAQEAALRGFFRFPEGGKIYLYPVMAQAKMGEALAAISMSVFLTQAGVPVKATQSRFMSWDGMRGAHMILMGHADSNPWLEPVLRSAPFTLAQTDERRRARILNRHPREGEQSEYFPALPEQSRSYALLSMLPGVDGVHEVLVVGGLDTSSTTAAAEFLLSAKSAESLLGKLKALAPGRSGPWHFQAVLETDVRDTVALKASVIALRLQ